MTTKSTVKGHWGIKNHAGERFHKLTVIELCNTGKLGHAIWKCKCDCGKTQKHIASIMNCHQTNIHYILSGKTWKK